MSDISCKVYMSKAVICSTLVMSTVIIVLYLCMVTTWTCIHTYIQEYLKNSRSSTVCVHKESSIIWPDPFLAQGVYHL